MSSPLPSVWFVLLVFVLLALLSWAGTRGYIALARREGILDVPNERSSHSIPTPRGGGIVFVVLFLLFTASCLVLFPGEAPLWRAILVGGSAVAFVGWMDDRKRGVPVRTRLAVHGAASVWVLAQLGGMPTIAVWDEVVYLGFFGHVLAFIGGMWVTNLYNFMDGIDGLAAGEAVCVAGTASILIVRYGTPASFALMALAACVIGFLAWNLPRARVFMGDVGSYFLGFVFFAFALYTKNEKILSLFLWASLLSVFVVDATFTLLARAIQGKPLTEGHREHIYQQAVLAGFSHGAVTSAALGVTLLACLAVYLDGVKIFRTFVLVYAVLICAWFAARYRLRGRPGAGR